MHSKKQCFKINVRNRVTGNSTIAFMECRSACALNTGTHFTRTLKAKEYRLDTLEWLSVERTGLEENK